MTDVADVADDTAGPDLVTAKAVLIYVVKQLVEHPDAVPEEDEQAAEKEELYDEINSLFNMENPKGDDQDDRRSQYST